MDEAKVRSEMVCSVGLLLVPKQVVVRLDSDDQLAAVLADGVAFNLQLQSARLNAEGWAIFGAEVAGAAALWTVPGGVLAANVGAGIAGRALYKRMEEQRGRIALSLLGEAGYDPWQAPEAWRLLAPKKLPNAVGSMNYPDRSGYKLGILNLQYGKRAAGAPLP